MKKGNERVELSLKGKRTASAREFCPRRKNESGREGSLAGPRSPDRAGWVALDRGRLEGIGGAGGAGSRRTPARGAHHTVTLFLVFLWVFVCVFVAPVSLSKTV